LRRILPWACFGLAAATVTVLAVAAPMRGRAAVRSADSTGAAGAADEETVPLRLTGGGELDEQEDREVRATLAAYLAAIQKRDWRAAAKHVDRESFLDGVEPLIERVAPDPALRAQATRSIFGVGTKDSLERRSTEELFASMMTYATAADPAGTALMEKARFALLGARKIRDRVHIAYQLTLPAHGDSTQPYTRVTAERLRKVGGDWKIVIQND
jgi:hypothetical protein